MNVMKTSNAKKGPHKAMNAYEEYSDKELDAQVAAITMDHLGMSNFECNNDSKVYCTFWLRFDLYRLENKVT